MVADGRMKRKTGGCVTPQPPHLNLKRPFDDGININIRLPTMSSIMNFPLYDPDSYIPYSVLIRIGRETYMEVAPFLLCDDPYIDYMEVKSHYLRDIELVLDLTGNLDSLCESCGQPTGGCEEDTILSDGANHIGPLCEGCLEEVEEQTEATA